MRTKTAILYETGDQLKIDEVEIPELRRGQVQIKVLHTGVCHSQLDEIRALKGPDKYLPHTMGHEAAGFVERIGQDVSKVQEGDYVVLLFPANAAAAILGAGKEKAFLDHPLAYSSKIILLFAASPLTPPLTKI